MQLASQEFSNLQMIPANYTCKGNNINPPLEISDAPAQTKSLALIVIDPDAPHGDFTHWLIWDIPPATQRIDADSAPHQATQGVNGTETIGYMGPCPPSGTHRYIFSLYALDTMLNLATSIKADELISALEGHILEKAELVGTFSA